MNCAHIQNVEQKDAKIAKQISRLRVLRELNLHFQLDLLRHN